MSNALIDIHDFLDLNLVDKEILLRNHAQLIDTYDTGYFKFRLYTLGNFYVEVKMVLDKSFELKAKEAVPFLKGPRLNKYLDKVDLDTLGLTVDTIHT